jgi:tetratricopeptide (TPR) repeat protein
MSSWHEAEFHARRAQHYLRAARWSEALAHFIEATEVRPDQVDWHFGMGLSLDGLGRYDEAVRAFRRVLELRPDDTEAMLLLGIDLLRTARPDEAATVLADLSQREPDSAAGYAYRILAYGAIDEHELAEQMFYLAVQADEHAPEAYDHMAHCLARLGEFERAIACWQRTLQLDPRHLDARFSLAMIRWQQGERHRARRLLLRQLRVVPEDVQAMAALGQLLVELDRPAEAGEQFARVAELDPEHAEAHLHLGDLARQSGHLDAAVRSYQRALEVDAWSPGVHLGLALVAHATGETETALHHARQEWAIPGQTGPQLLALARLLIQLNLPDQVLRLLSEIEIGLVLGTPAQQSACMLYRGIALTMTGEPRVALAEFRLAMRLTPNDPAPLHNAILACIEIGEHRRAAALLRRLGRRMPTDPMRHALQRRLRQVRHAQRRRGAVLTLRRLLGWRSRPASDEEKSGT